MNSSSDTPSLAARLWRSTPLRLALLAFVVYNLNFKSEGSFDVFATRYLPVSVVTQGNLDLDEFPTLHRYPDWWGGGAAYREGSLPYYVQRERGHYVSTYPVMPAILSAPIYAVPVWLLKVTHQPLREFYVKLMAKTSASAAVAASVAIMYLALLRMGGDRRRAFWIACVYAFATSSWANSSQGLWQTSWSQPLIALTLYLLLRADEGRAYLVGAGIALALAVACRPPDIVIALVLSLYVLHRHGWRIVSFAIAPIVIGGLLAAHNYYWFGTLIGGYAGEIQRVNASQPSGGFTFSVPQWTAFWGLLISPGRGMLYHSPVLAFGFLGMAVALRQPQRHLLMAYTAAATLATILFYSTWSIWYAGNSFSYRFLVDLLPGLCLMLALVWGWIVASRPVWSVFVATMVFSVAVQIIGVVFYPSDWYDRPVSPAVDHSRFWDWKDPEILRCLMAGPHLPWQSE